MIKTHPFFDVIDFQPHGRPSPFNDPPSDDDDDDATKGRCVFILCCSFCVVHLVFSLVFFLLCFFSCVVPLLCCSPLVLFILCFSSCVVIYLFNVVPMILFHSKYRLTLYSSTQQHAPPAPRGKDCPGFRSVVLAQQNHQPPSRNPCLFQIQWFQPRQKEFRPTSPRVSACSFVSFGPILLPYLKPR